MNKIEQRVPKYYDYVSYHSQSVIKKVENRFMCDWSYMVIANHLDATTAKRRFSAGKTSSTATTYWIGTEFTVRKTEYGSNSIVNKHWCLLTIEFEPYSVEVLSYQARYSKSSN